MNFQFLTSLKQQREQAEERLQHQVLSPMAAAVLKMRCGGEVRRARLEQPAAGLQFGDLSNAIAEAWAGIGKHELKYLDEENDLCTLCPETFQDFLATARDQETPVTVLRLEIITSSGPPPPAPVPSATPASLEPGRARSSESRKSAYSVMTAPLPAGESNKAVKQEYCIATPTPRSPRGAGQGPEDEVMMVQEKLTVEHEVTTLSAAAERCGVADDDAARAAAPTPISQSASCVDAMNAAATAVTEGTVAATLTQRRCAREECGFQATWHPTHCCEACKAGRGKNDKFFHGPRCQQLSWNTAVDCQPEPKATQVEQDGGDEVIDEHAAPTAALGKHEADVHQHLMEKENAVVDGLGELVIGDTLQSRAADNGGEPVQAAAPIAANDEVAAPPKKRRCVRATCNFQATWHATHCCLACELGIERHGCRCEQLPMPEEPAINIQMVKAANEELAPPLPIVADPSSEVDGEEAKAECAAMEVDEIVTTSSISMAVVQGEAAAAITADVAAAKVDELLTTSSISTAVLQGEEAAAVTADAAAAKVKTAVELETSDVASALPAAEPLSQSLRERLGARLWGRWSMWGGSSSQESVLNANAQPKPEAEKTGDVEAASTTDGPVLEAGGMTDEACDATMEGGNGALATEANDGFDNIVSESNSNNMNIDAQGVDEDSAEPTASIAMLAKNDVVSCEQTVDAEKQDANHVDKEMISEVSVERATLAAPADETDDDCTDEEFTIVEIGDGDTDEANGDPDEATAETGTM